jgi:signal transduction histidine kinase
MINCFADYDENNIWIGTEESGLFLFNRQTLKFKQFKPEAKNKNSLAGENVKVISRESDGNLWIGYYASGLDYFDLRSGKLTHFQTNKKRINSITSNSIRSLLLDHEENLWIGTDKGLDLFLKNKHTLRHFNLNMDVLTLFEDRKNQVWAGTSGDGVYRLKSDSLTFKKVYPLYFTTSIKAIHVDSNDNLWVGTNKGLYFVNSKNDSIFHFGVTDGLPSNIVLDILEDNHRNLWVSTGAGLIKCEKAVNNPLNLIVKQFNISDGLQGVQFRESASYKNSKNEFYFGGDQGFNIFNPDSIKSNPYPPRLAFTELRIFNNKVEIGDRIKGRVVLDKAINQKKELILSYLHSQISIEFAALHFSNPENNKYKFRLLPLEKEWNSSTGIRNFATYSNLQGGNYSFEVKAANSDDLWGTDPLVLKIKVMPPFWKTWWFIGILIIFLSVSILGYYLYRISSLERHNAELEQKVKDRTSKLKESFDNLLEKQSFIEEQSRVLKQQTDQLIELNSTKDKFFSIISHDLRSPFQSLMGISELLMEELNQKGNDKQKSYAHTIYESSNHIYSLVENLLTWSQTQTNKLTFDPVETNLPNVIESVLILLQPNFEQKHISVEKKYLSVRHAFADKNMIEMVIRNLISNAIKFTPENRKISIVLTDNKNDLQVEIIDEGFGISPENQKKLFKIDSDFTRQGTNGERGTGLGLILCKEFIEKNNGRIWVESKADEGSSFYFTLPICKLPEK